MLIPPRHVFFSGPRKTGTITVYDILRKQNARIPRSVNETFFFDQPDVGLNECERKYKLDPKIPFIEMSPSYFTNEHAQRNLKNYCPDPWIVITLRDPIKSCFSAISHAERVGQLDPNDLRLVSAFENKKHVRNILQTSNFEPYIESWADDRDAPERIRYI